MNKYLLDDRPLTVLPTLAKLLGSVERAIVLQQIHWLLQQPKSGIERDGYKWVWGTYEEWTAEYFPMWEPRVLRSHIVWLEKEGYLVSEQPRREQWDRTKYYRIEYSTLHAESETSILPDRVASELPILVVSEVPDRVASELPNRVGSLSETTTDISAKDTSETTTITPGMAAVFSCYETNIGPLTAYLSELIAQAVDDFGAVVVMDAIKTATTANVRKWAYVNGILERWRANGRSRPKGQPLHQPGEKFTVQFPGDVVEELTA